MIQRMKVPKIRVNTEASIRQEDISENHHCVIVDDFLQNPHEIVDFAANNAVHFSTAKSHYPGLFVDVDDEAI
jgi:hypothetical protein